MEGQINILQAFDRGGICRISCCLITSGRLDIPKHSSLLEYQNLDPTHGSRLGQSQQSNLVHLQFPLKLEEGDHEFLMLSIHQH